MIVLHGVGHDGAGCVRSDSTTWRGPSGVAVAYPDGADGMWNDGRPGADPPPDGAGWATTSRSCACSWRRAHSGMDRGVRSVGVVGFSNGAIMAARVACDMSDLVTVVAIVDGSAGEGFETHCSPVLPVSVALVATRGDPVVPYGGGQVAPWDGHARGRVSGADATVRFWSRADGCTPLHDAGVAATSPMVARAQADNCLASRRVVRLAIDDAQHDWIRTSGFDTTATVWAFLRDQLARSFDNDVAQIAGMS